VCSNNGVPRPGAASDATRAPIVDGDPTDPFRRRASHSPVCKTRPYLQPSSFSASRNAPTAPDRPGPDRSKLAKNPSPPRCPFSVPAGAARAAVAQARGVCVSSSRPRRGRRARPQSAVESTMSVKRTVASTPDQGSARRARRPYSSSDEGRGEARQEKRLRVADRGGEVLGPAARRGERRGRMRFSEVASATHAVPHQLRRG
jgi:hypothetical protein